MKYSISAIAPQEYVEVVDLWEISVRATHHFLPEADIEFFKPLILRDYLKAVTLSCIRDDRAKIIAFAGVAEDKMEMLFVHPAHFGKGLGKALTLHCIQHHQINKVDVNEDNPGAAAFYQRMGFKVINRSPLDPLGKPYPILHLELNKEGVPA